MAKKAGMILFKKNKIAIGINKLTTVYVGLFLFFKTN